MKLLIVLLIFTVFNFIKADLNAVNQQQNTQTLQLPNDGIAVDEVVVESSLYIKPKQTKPQIRRTRRSIFTDMNTLKSLVEHKRVKRQFSRSQAIANAMAQAHYNDRFGHGNSAANAQGQAFAAQGPSASFGASSAGSVTQALNANRFGVQNSAGASHALTFNLPNGQSVNFANTNSFANGPDGNNANSRGTALSVNTI